ncbi:DNA repair protein RAD51 homolog 2 isoform X1 [Nerophis lumbriciformis]|uniref:DNA repair protein RAD51 homolog 2 isoform X1 n=1 Tax=Nerophis lumbriciformis TaxID=546530 RepID=UPI002ADF8CD8|nr:DNA repair protein RAD51 homolog 2-like isoform X1 [Nerophis lumbriciformis]
MASRALKRAGVSPELCQQLKRSKIESCKELLSRSPFEVMHAAGLSYQDALEMLVSVSRVIAPSPITALELWKRHSDSCFSTSLPALDKVLRGGLPCGNITEVAGPSGCGKTQFCLMLSVLATLPKELGGLDRSVIYIDTESAFSAERLVEIAQSRFRDRFCSKEKVLEMASRVHVYRDLTCQDVLNRLERLEEIIISTGAGLIILDSVASVVRKEFDTTLPGNLIHRSNMLGKEATMLKYLAHQFNIPVVLTNQITTHIGHQDSRPTAEKDCGFVTTALGNTWSHSINTRFIVQYMAGCQRQLLVAKSPVAPFAVLNYVIQKEGIYIVENDGEDILYEGMDPSLQPIRVRTELNIDSN